MSQLSLYRKYLKIDAYKETKGMQSRSADVLDG